MFRNGTLGKKSFQIPYKCFRIWDFRYPQSLFKKKLTSAFKPVFLKKIPLGVGTGPTPWVSLTGTCRLKVFIACEVLRVECGIISKPFCQGWYPPFLETNSSHLKMDGWKPSLSYWGPAYFSGAFAVSFREGNRQPSTKNMFDVFLKNLEGTNFSIFQLARDFVYGLGGQTPKTIKQWMKVNKIMFPLKKNPKRVHLPQRQGIFLRPFQTK